MKQRDSKKYLKYSQGDVWPYHDYDKERLTKVRNSLTYTAFGSFFALMFEYDNSFGKNITDATSAVAIGSAAMLLTFTALGELQSYREKKVDDFILNFEKQTIEHIALSYSWPKPVQQAEQIDPPTEDLE